jgi:hypothetical protein
LIRPKERYTAISSGSGEGEGAGAGAADLGGHQMEIDQAGHSGRALTALVHPHRPEAEHPGGLRPPTGQLEQVGLGDAAKGTHPFGGPLATVAPFTHILSKGGGVEAITAAPPQ